MVGTKFWERRVELAPRTEVQQIQLKRLNHILRYVYANSRFYKSVFDREKLDVEKFNRLSDLSRFPFTTKEDLRRSAYPYGGDFLCVPRNRISLFHMTSGTTGKPVVGPYTPADVENWTNLMARTYTAAGTVAGDIVMNVYGYGLFTGGMGFHQSAQRVGAAVIPWSVGRSEGLVQALKDFRATVLTGTPSYELYILETARKMGIDPIRDLKLRVCIPGAEIWNDGIKRRIEEGFGLKEKGGGARNIYGATELYGPGAGVECEYQNGFHFWVDHFYLEIIDPDTLEPVGPGEQGEMVVTTLTKEAMPLIRYRLRDLTVLNEEPCGCGRKAFPRCMWVRGRIDDVIHYKGAKVWPSAIQGALLKFGEVQEYQVLVDKSSPSYSFAINVELSSSATQGVKDRIDIELRKAIFFKFDLNFVRPGSLPRYEGKAKRVIVKEAS